ncbi:hypothetical protein, partial [Planotetraspora phitsanulokensis]
EDDVRPRIDIHAAIRAGIKGFDFAGYGLDEVDPNDENAEWVDDLAQAIINAIADRAVMGEPQ